MAMTILRTINALTLCTRDMERSCAFYSSLGLKATFGGPAEAFTTFSANAPVTKDNNALHINLVLSPGYEPPKPQPGVAGGWGRAVIFVDDVDTLHSALASSGVCAPAPRDAPWGERYFHVLDPDGHELSFATPDYDHPRWAPMSAVSSAAKSAVSSAVPSAASSAAASEALGRALEELREEQRADSATDSDGGR